MYLVENLLYEIDIQLSSYNEQDILTNKTKPIVGILRRDIHPQATMLKKEVARLSYQASKRSVEADDLSNDL